MRRLLGLLLLVLAGRSGCIQFDGQEVRPGEGVLKQLFTCYVPGDASALPLQLIGHVVSFQSDTGDHVDRRPMLLAYAPFFAGQIFFLPSALSAQVELQGVHSYCASPCERGPARAPA